MTTYADYAHEVYLACTPAMAAEYLRKHADSREAKRWDREAFDRKLQKLGVGMLLVEGDARRTRPNDVGAQGAVMSIDSMFPLPTRRPPGSRVSLVIPCQCARSDGATSPVACDFPGSMLPNEPVTLRRRARSDA